MENNIGVDNVTIMSLNQMCDLALGFVQPGVIHFDLLHQILRAIIHQNELTDVKIRLQGEKSVEIQKFTTPQKTSQITIPSTEIGSSQLNIPGSTVKKSTTEIPPDTSQTLKKAPSIKVSNVKKSTTEIPPDSSQTLKKAPSMKVSTVKKSATELPPDGSKTLKTPSTKGSNVIILDQATNKPLEHTVSISVEQMQWIVDSIESLQKQINEMKQLPSNQDILDSLREGHLSKTSSITKASQKTPEKSPTPQKPIGRNLSDTPIVDMLQMLTLTRRVDAAEESITKLASLIEEIAREYPVGSREHLLDIESLSDLRGASIASLGNRQALELITKELKGLKQLIYGEGDAQPTNANLSQLVYRPSKSSETDDLGTAGANLQTKVVTVDVKMKQVLDQIENVDRSTAEQINNIAAQCSGFEDTMARLERKLVDSLVSQKAPLMSLNERYNKMEEEMDQMRIDHKKVIDAYSKRELQMSAFIEQVEVLKTCKVNREEFEDALDKKLDNERILTKVSQERFDQVYDDLKMELEETINKLTTQEEMWQKALFELQGELVTKLEKNELVALQDFVKEKLKNLRDKVKSMKYYQTEREAAATKQMLMKNVKCLSCDADVTTRVKQLPQDYPKSPALPPTKTIAPYLIYELDVMRKQQRELIHSRNMHHFEASVRNKGQRVENRYCGGPHTVTTPVQRVTRLGHFIEQWGPEITTPNENYVKGTDHKVYVGCTNGTDSNRRQSIIIEGNIVKEKKDHHEDVAHIPEKDPGSSKLEINKKTVSITADLGKSASAFLTKKSSSRKNLDVPNEEIGDKISAFSFDDNPDEFPYL